MDAVMTSPTPAASAPEPVHSPAASSAAEAATSEEPASVKTEPPPPVPEVPDAKEEATSSEPAPAKRVHWPEEGEEESASLDTARALWAQQDAYINQLEAKVGELQREREQEAASVDGGLSRRDLELKCRDGVRREQLLVMRLSAKEQELQELAHQLAETKAAAVAPYAASANTAHALSSLKSTLVDPAVNLVLQRLQRELAETKKKMTETQEELNAWKFTPDSATGKRLMSKCRQLLQENEDIGKMISSGRLAKLEGEVSMQKVLCDEMKKNQVEMDEFVQELDEDMEGMQSTIYYLQQQLKEAKETIARMESERKEGSADVKDEAAAEDRTVLEDDSKAMEVAEEEEERAATPVEAAIEETEAAKVEEGEERPETAAPEEHQEEEAEAEEDGAAAPEEEEPVVETRGRRCKKTPTKDAAGGRRGRSTRGQKREAAEDSTPEPSPSKGAGGRPKRRRAAKKLSESEEAGAEEDQEAAAEGAEEV